MARIVQKYGGTSVGDVERIKNVAQRIRAVRDAGHQLRWWSFLARAGVTNELIARARALCDNPSEREMDPAPRRRRSRETIALTAMALHGIGVGAVSYTGAQAGIFTDTVHTKAKIKTIDARPLEKEPIWPRAGSSSWPASRASTRKGKSRPSAAAAPISPPSPSRPPCRPTSAKSTTDVDAHVYTADPPRRPRRPQAR